MADGRLGGSGLWYQGGECGPGKGAQVGWDVKDRGKECPRGAAGAPAGERHSDHGGEAKPQSPGLSVLPVGFAWRKKE